MTVEEKIAEITAYMPETYKSIQAKAQQVGNKAYEWVRRGLRGEANCFYAFEAGHVVGTPFNRTDIMEHVSKYMVQFGCEHIVIWATEGQVHGAH